MSEPVIVTQSFKFAKEWLPSLIKALQKIKATRERDIDEIADVFGDPQSLAKYYVEPDCQQFNPADDDDEESRHVVREAIFKRIEYFFSGKGLSGGNHLFILADSGMGKTSVLMMLKLAHINSFWPKNYECILMKLGPDSLDAIRSITSKRHKILLLDALDEDSKAWGRIGQRISEILQETHAFRRVVITCRTQFFSGGEDPFNRRGQVEVGGYLCPVVYLSFFTDEQVELYCKKRFPNSAATIRRAQDILHKMRSLRCRPMLLSHIEDIMQSTTKEWNEYSIYEALVKVWLLREHKKMQKRNGTDAPSVDVLWSACQTVALELHRINERVIDEQAFE